MWDDDVMPIEIRPGLTVLIKGIPWDLTKAEADKLANVITALGGATGRWTGHSIITVTHARLLTKRLYEVHTKDRHLVFMRDGAVVKSVRIINDGNVQRVSRDEIDALITAPLQEDIDHDE